MAAVEAAHPVRLVITTDWSAGFHFWPGTEPLAVVPPGGEYLVDCFPREPVSIGEVIVRDFALVQVAVGNRVDQCVAALQRNDSSANLRPKTATLVRAGARSNEEIAYGR